MGAGLWLGALSTLVAATAALLRRPGAFEEVVRQRAKVVASRRRHRLLAELFSHADARLLVQQVDVDGSFLSVQIDAIDPAPGESPNGQQTGSL
jgi:hypothetical protein